MMVAVFTLGVAGCDIGTRESVAPGSRVVVYCSVDEAFARGILQEYSERSGANVQPVFDSEAGKTTGLIQRIRAEASSGRPRGDVFWSSEVFGTARLAQDGLLAPFDPPSAADIPSRFRDKNHRWTATSLRARVIAFDAAVSPPSRIPTRWEQLADPQYARDLAFANPLFGTTRGHVAAMFVLWGDERGRGFLKSLREGGADMVDGNSSAVRKVLAGVSRMAATDTDDVWLSQRVRPSLDLVYPDMGGGGTLMVPCSVAVIDGGPHPAAARGLADFLVSAEVERLLAECDSRNVPVRADLRKRLGIPMPPETRVDYNEVADAMEPAVAAIREILIR